MPWPSVPGNPKQQSRWVVTTAAVLAGSAHKACFLWSAEPMGLVGCEGHPEMMQLNVLKVPTTLHPQLSSSSAAELSL